MEHVCRSCLCVPCVCDAPVKDGAFRMTRERDELLESLVKCLPLAEAYVMQIDYRNPTSYTSVEVARSLLNRIDPSTK